MALGRFCNYVWWQVTHLADPNEVTKFRAKLWRPPRGERPDPRSPWSAENEAAAFQALKSGVGLS